jgi:hypothetical protein
MMRQLTALASLGAGLAFAWPGSAQEQTDPFWAEAADPQVATYHYPRFAALLEIEGRGRVMCWVERDGHPFLCDIVEEFPRGLGFGSAARIIVASAKVGVSRIDGRPVPTSIATNIRFRPADRRRGWTGPEPSEVRLSLAREVLAAMPEAFPFPADYRSMLMEGLDFDRRAVVGPWIDELMPMDEESVRRIRSIQIARLFGEDDLRRMLAGQPVEAPSPEAFDAACPELTPVEAAAIAELRRRYCDRYNCSLPDETSVAP